MIKKRATTAVTREDLKGKNLESYKVIEAEERLEKKIKPRLDYSDPANFVTYGAAEEYYVASVDNITNMYPYDGSKFEKTEWHVTASGLDNYLFDNRYPRQNGHISISHNGWGPEAATIGVKDVLPTNKEYILIQGGPNTDSASTLAELFPEFGGKSNIIDEEENRESNLTLGTENTVEFWMKKSSLVKPVEVIFDMWNSGSVSGSSDYGRFTVYLDAIGETIPGSGFPIGDTPLCVAYNSGTYGIGGTPTSTPQAFALPSVAFSTTSGTITPFQFLTAPHLCISMASIMIQSSEQARTNLKEHSTPPLAHAMLVFLRMALHLQILLAGTSSPPLWTNSASGRQLELQRR